MPGLGRSAAHHVGIVEHERYLYGVGDVDTYAAEELAGSSRDALHGSVGGGVGCQCFVECCCVHIGLARCLQCLVHGVELLAALVERIFTVGHVALLDEGPLSLAGTVGEGEVTAIGPRYVENLAILLIGERIHAAALLYLGKGEIGIGILVDHHIVGVVAGA